MIDFDRVRQLRDLRLFSVVMTAICVGTIVADWVPLFQLLIGFIAAFFTLRAIEYTTRIRELELDIEDLRHRERRNL